MSAATHPLSREHLRTAFGRLMPCLSEGMQRLAEALLDLISPDGSISVQQAHARLFPATDNTKSASAQLNNVLKAIHKAAQDSGLALDHQFEGSKQGGTAGRKLRFLGPPPLLVAETDTLNAIDPAQRINDQQGDPLVQEHKVVLLTFNEHEFNAVRQAFWADYSTQPQTASYPLPDRPPVSVDVLGSFGNIRLFHHHSRQGNRESQRAAADLHMALQPRAMVAVGIAFGADARKQAIAEVLVSEFVVDYELGKLHKDGNLTLRGKRPPASRTWLRALEQLDTRQNASTAKTTWPKLHFGGILSGEKLVDHLDYRNRLMELAGQDDIVGGEMEAAGLFTALEGTRTDWLVVKAICDWADGQKGQGKERRQQHAAANAAQVVHALITGGMLYPDAPEHTELTLNTSMSPARRAPRTMDTHELMRRARLSEVDDCAQPYEPNRGSHVGLDILDEHIRTLRSALGQDDQGVVAFDDILHWVHDPDSPPLYALLGEYGMGKTTTSQRVFEHLRSQHARGELARPALYFDLRKVERLVPASDTSPGAVPSLQEAVEDCLKNGYVSDGMQAPSYADVLRSIDQGAVVIFDGLDEVLSRIQDKQGLTFTSNLLRVLADAQARRQARGHADKDAPKPKVLLSCRTQFFRSLREQNNHLTGEHRGAQPARQYRALVLRPFTEPQVRAYLQAALPEADVAQLMQRIATIHNLTDLSKRPFTLKLVSRFLPKIEHWQAEGRTVTGATLYREVAREWLIRDKEKQSFQPEDKERLAASLAAHLWQQQLRGLDAPALEAWLGAWLLQQAPGSDCLSKPRNLLQQDLRNATFLRRIDDDAGSRFEFSHSSLQEFFLAEFLASQVISGMANPKDAALQARLHSTWAGPEVIAETLDFLGQILSEHPQPDKVIEVLNAWRKTYRPNASELLLRYALHAPNTAPRPLLAGFDLRGAQLRDWVFGDASDSTAATALLPMQGCLLQGADLRGTRFSRVRLDEVDFSGSQLTQAAFVACHMARTHWAGAECIGTVFRHCELQGSDLTAANAYRAQRIACSGGGAEPQTQDPSAWLAPPPIAPSTVIPQHQHLTWGAGHNSWVNDITFSPDGRRIASASTDNTLGLWDSTSGEALLTLSGHTNTVNAVVFSPDGQHIASASSDHTLRIWDAASGQALRTISGHTNSVYALAFSPDGRRIASGSADNTLRLWDVATGEALLTLSGHTGAVNDVAFSPDGRHIASASSDHTLRLWNATSGEFIITLSGHTDAVNAVAFSPDGWRIASASNDRSLRLWDAVTADALLSFNGHTGAVNDLAFSSDGRRIVSVCFDNTLRIWDASSGEALLVITDGAFWCMAVAFSPDGRCLASASIFGSPLLRDSATGSFLFALDVHESYVNAVAFSPDGHRFVSASYDNTLRLWDTTSYNAPSILSGHCGWVSSVVFSPDGRHLASTHSDNTLRTWDVTTDQALEILSAPAVSINAAAFSPDGRYIVSTSDDHTLLLWDAATGQAVLVLSGHTDRVNAATFSPDGRGIVSASDDHTLLIWDAATGEARLTLSGHTGRVNAVAFSQDGKRIASASSDNTVLLWDATTGQVIQTLSDHPSAVNAVAFSPDGRRIASASSDHTLRLWNATSGQALLTLSGHTGAVNAVAFSPDGRHILSASNDDTLRLWDAESGACLRGHWACARGKVQGHAIWTPPGADSTHPEGRLLSASGDAWRVLGWQVWDHPSEPGQWTRLPLGTYPQEAAAVD